MRRRTASLLLLAALAMLPAGAAAQSADDVYIMRHLEQQGGAGAGDDPGLSPAGKRQADRLATWFRDRPRAVFASTTRRAMETAGPLARRLGVPLETYDAADPDRLLDRVKRTRGVVLIVGHSNTVPDLIRRMGAIGPREIPHTRYGQIWRVPRRGGVATESILPFP